MLQLYESLREHKISLSYFGVFSDTVTTMLIELSEEYVSKQSQLKKTKRKVSFLIAESFQNVLRHGVADKRKIADAPYKNDFFQINLFDDRVEISSANVIKNNDAEELNRFIDNVNTLSPEELKSLKFDVLENSEMSDKGGAGLGIIEMVRKTGLPLKKKFTHISDEFSLVVLSLEIAAKDTEPASSNSINTVEVFYRKLIDKGIVMLYKGDFSAASNTSLIEMLNTNFLKRGEIDPENLKDIVVIIELMQNVSKHGKEIKERKEGLFALTLNDGEHHIICCNFIKRADYQELDQQLKIIKDSDLKSLDKMYKDKLLSHQAGSDDIGGGMGLLEIARFSKNTFTYRFQETSDDELFFTIATKTV